MPVRDERFHLANASLSFECSELGLAQRLNFFERRIFAIDY